MKIGCCLNMTVQNGNGIGIENLYKISNYGFDYIEISLRHFMELSKFEQNKVIKIIQDEGIPCETCNNFIPPSISLTGNNIKFAHAFDYAVRSFEAAHRLGAQLIVFGSGAARMVPNGFPLEKALDQLSFFITKMLDFSKQLGIQIAIEHLNKKECNIINSYKEAEQFSNRFNCDKIGPLLDLYHYSIEEESLDDLKKLNTLPIHVHIANKKNRKWPRDPDSFLIQAIEILIKQGYNKRISIEGFPTNIEEDCIYSLQWLSKYK